MSIASDYFASEAKDFRRQAEYWDRVAALAEDDGDKYHAASAAGKAADFRQRAREIEASQP